MPRTNLVYANQQFFDGSRWQWTVPPLRADNALVNGPLPLMTLWRKERGLDAESVSRLWRGCESILPRPSASHALGCTRPEVKPRGKPRGQAPVSAVFVRRIFGLAA